MKSWCLPNFSVQIAPDCILEYLRADVCKYRPEMGKIEFLKNPKKIM